MAEQMKDAAARKVGVSTVDATIIFCTAALATLGAGVVLEVSADAIAQRIRLSGVLFGATVLAAATALPEISSGLGSVRLGDCQLAISDIFGGNAFLPVLFLLATRLAGKSVLPLAQDTDIYLAGLGIYVGVHRRLDLSTQSPTARHGRGFAGSAPLDEVDGLLAVGGLGHYLNGRQHRRQARRSGRAIVGDDNPAALGCVPLT